MVFLVPSALVSPEESVKEKGWSRLSHVLAPGNKYQGVMLTHSYIYNVLGSSDFICFKFYFTSLIVYFDYDVYDTNLGLYESTHLSTHLFIHLSLVC